MNCKLKANFTTPNSNSPPDSLPWPCPSPVFPSKQPCRSLQALVILEFQPGIPNLGRIQSRSLPWDVQCPGCRFVFTPQNPSTPWAEPLLTPRKKLLLPWYGAGKRKKGGKGKNPRRKGFIPINSVQNPSTEIHQPHTLRHFLLWEKSSSCPDRGKGGKGKEESKEKRVYYVQNPSAESHQLKSINPMGWAAPDSRKKLLLPWHRAGKKGEKERIQGEKGLFPSTVSEIHQPKSINWNPSTPRAEPLLTQGKSSSCPGTGLGKKKKRKKKKESEESRVYPHEQCPAEQPAVCGAHGMMLEGNSCTPQTSRPISQALPKTPGLPKVREKKIPVHFPASSALTGIEIFFASLATSRFNPEKTQPN